MERIRDVSPSLRRITFRPLDPVAEGFAAAPQAGSHCRLHFRDAVQAYERPPSRVFTLRRHLSGSRFEIDFALHGGAGVAAAWIQRAEEGDTLGVSGPLAPKIDLRAAPEAEAVLIADITCLPAVAAMAERAPGAGIRVLLSVPHEDDAAALDGAAACLTRAVVEPAPGSAFIDAVRLLRPSANATLFVACEAAAMRAIRRLALDTWKLPRQQVFTSGYWKRGLTSEQVDRAKRQPDWFGDERTSAHR